MKRVSRVILFLLLFAKSEGTEKETFILDLLEKETFSNLVDREGHFSVEFLPKNIDALKTYTDFKAEISPYLDFEEKKDLGGLYDAYYEYKEKKLAKQAEKKPDDFSEKDLAQIKRFSDYEKGLLTKLESDSPSFELSLEDVLALDDLAETILSEVSNIDEAIEKKSANWKLDRMAKTDLTLLRMGVYELSEMQANLANLVDDYVEIAKAYSGEEGYKFINGVLDAYYKEELSCK